MASSRTATAPTLQRRRAFAPVVSVHSAFDVVHVELRQRGLGEPESEYAWLWQHSEAKRRILEYLFWQLATNQPPHGVGIDDGRLIFLQEVKNATGRRSRSAVLDASPRQFDAQAEQMAHEWNEAAQQRGLPLISLSELALRGDWHWENRDPLPDLLGMVPVVLACCAKWHLQDPEFRILCSALEAHCPPPGAPVPPRDLPSRQMVVLFLAKFAYDTNPTWPEEARKALAVALRGLHDGPTNQLVVQYAPDHPLRIVSVKGATPEAQAILDALLRSPDAVPVPKPLAPAIEGQDDEDADDEVLRVDPEVENEEVAENDDTEAAEGPVRDIAGGDDVTGEGGAPAGGHDGEDETDHESDLGSSGDGSDGMGSDDGWGEY